MRFPKRFRLVGKRLRTVGINGGTPAVVSCTVSADGTTVTIVTNTPISGPNGAVEPSGEFNINPLGFVLTFVSGDRTKTTVWTTGSDVVLQGQVVTLQLFSGNDVYGYPGGPRMWAFSGFSVTNNSVQT